jgi:predicted dehydrogenase
VRSGAVGRLRHVEVGMPVDPTAPDDPPQPVPPNLNYNAWLGSTPEVYYTEQRVHPNKGYDRPGWLRNETYCLGMITGHGAHYFDIANWGMNMEASGPEKAEGRAEFPTNKIWNVHGSYDIEFAYPGDIKMTVSDKLQTGVRFIGDEGWIFVHAGNSAVTTTDPQGRKSKLQPLDASDPKLLAPERVKVELYRSANQHANWLECVRSRKQPVAPAAVGHRANTACNVGWIAMKLGRPLRWDARAQKFIGNDAANALLSRPQRAPYGTNRLVPA